MQLNPQFHTFEDLVKGVVEQQTIDWLMVNSQFSSNVVSYVPCLKYEKYTEK